MCILIATDVFGMTPAVDSLVRALGQACVVVSPFDDKHCYFQSEQKAYYAFLAQGGVSRYAEKVTDALASHGTDITMTIGFSAGASALWIASEKPAAAQLAMAILFYGSRIRDHRQVQPRCPVRLIFAEHEAAFNVKELTHALQNQGHHAQLVANMHHGFMNPYSSGFCVKTQNLFLDELKEMARALAVAGELAN